MKTVGNPDVYRLNVLKMNRVIKIIVQIET